MGNFTTIQTLLDVPTSLEMKINVDYVDCTIKYVIIIMKKELSHNEI